MDIFDFIEDKHYQYEKALKHKPIKLFEAFAGIGCQAMAFNKLGIPYESVGISEIDKYAIMSYNAIHGKTKNYGDICKMEQIPKCDIFTWSFPCTDLSKAGKQAGLTDTRSGLVYEVIRLLQVTDHKPKVLIMENVVDLVQVKFKAEFYEIQKEIEKLGYTNYTQTLNAKHHGVAQNRNRVFMVSILGDSRYEFPPRVKLEKRLKDYLEESVDEKYYLSEKMVKFFKENSINNQEKGNGFRFKPQQGYKAACAITTNAGNRMDDNFLAEPTAGVFQPKDRDYNKNGGKREEQFEPRSDGVSNTVLTHSIKNCIAIPEATVKGYALAEDGDGVYINRPHQKRGVVQKGMIQTIKTSGTDVGVVVKFKKKYSERSMQDINNNMVDVNDCANTLTAQHQRPTINSATLIRTPLRIRKLTPLECWRLMGIDDQDFKKAQKVVSNSQLYKQAGNGIVVDVFAAILKGLIEKGAKDE